MKISKIPGLGNYGHFIDDLDFNNLTADEWMDIGRFHARELDNFFSQNNSYDHSY